ncbi:NHL repeat-containing protein [Marinomonas transparens]|uniref:NHL repeat-containing protein n=1 Tax=Marinomonas transparens TaxID=2795388 RepID=A0A934N5X8_9GAMM|nr:NHL repeat-containing protein [Marinomonas transparens]MBJ7537506.1 NHL repeat-containing protein [Marinomonas transparens]
MKLKEKIIPSFFCLSLSLSCFGEEQNDISNVTINLSANNTGQVINNTASRYSNISSDGKFLIDVLFVFTPLAKSLLEADAADPDEYALRHINKTNDDLQRSQITTSKLRYAGKHYVTEADYARTNRYPDSSNGTHVLMWLLNLRAAYGADKIAVIHSGVWNNALGDSASFPYNHTLPFSHEIGHTMGLGHGGCDPNVDYSALGYANGAQYRWLNFIDGEEVPPYISTADDAGSIMCGNNSGFFTNANMVLSWQQIIDFVNQGHLPQSIDFYEPLKETGMKMGHVDYADAARQWMEVDEATSNNYPTSLPQNYSESEWYEKDNCLAFYNDIDYSNLISEICIGDSINDTAAITNYAESIKIGRNTALRLYSDKEYMAELSTLFYSSSNLDDYFSAHSGALSDTVYIEAFHKDDRDAFFASPFSVSKVLGEGRDWFTPNGLTVSSDGSEIIAMHGGIDIFSATGSLIRELDIDDTEYAFGLTQTTAGDLFIANDRSCRVVNKVSGEVTTISDCRGSDADIDSEGNLYIVHRGGYIRKLALQEDGTFTHSLFIDYRTSSSIGDNNHLKQSTGIAIDKNRDLMYIVDAGHCRVQVFDLSGNYQRTIGAEPGLPCENSPSRGGELRTPFGIAVDDQGYVYVSETYQPWYHSGRPRYFNVGVQVFDEEGNYLTQFANDMIDPGYVAADSQGKIYVMESGGELSASTSKVLVFEKVSD